VVSAFIYPRRVSIRRPNTASAVNFGTVGAYGGAQPVNEAEVLSDLPASIQYDRVGKTPDANLPAGASGRSQWKILIPAESAELGSIKRDDVVVDDLGARYVVNAPYWNSLGFGLRCDLLTV
jgi:hypothetical protein